MNVTAVIAEYNPFHLGHRYQIEQIKQTVGGAVVVIMSGNFVQRGDVACMSKWARSKAAILCGADLVIELPVSYAVSTAERFAFGGVSLAIGLGCVTHLAFGAETANLGLLKETAQLLCDDKLYQKLREHSAAGMTFAAARQLAAAELAGERVAAVLEQPNNILATEYLRQLLEQQSSIQPIAIARKGAGHHQQGEALGFASASHIRALIENGEEAFGYMPKESADILMQEQICGLAPAMMRGNDRVILSRLRSITDEAVRSLPDITEGIEYRLLDGIKAATSTHELEQYIKTKRYTMARVRRLILSAALGIDGRLCMNSPPYLHLLGIGELGAKVLAEAKSKAKLPISHSLAELERMGGEASVYAKAEANAGDLFGLLTPKACPCGLDYRTPPFVLGR